MSENKTPARRGYFRDRAVVVTGASSGIGYDVAMALGLQGAEVGLIARRKSKLEELAERITEGGGRAEVLQCDVTRRAEVQSAIDEAARAFGQIDILINSAGLLIPDTIEEMRPDDLERMMAVNLYGTLHTTQAVLPAMKKNRSGRIINVASLAGRRGISPLGGYSATKFAVVGLTEALRVELFGTGVSASLVMPGVIDTPMSQEARSNKILRAMPAMAAMPARWVTWAILAAAAFGLPEVDVPPGATIVQKLAALFPTATDLFLSVGTRIVDVLSQRLLAEDGAPSALPRERAIRNSRRADSAQTAAN
jgi:NAD(P)-dependent dehydrogenase (short-subunit alcohol dehydrogenase family)